MEKIKIAHLVSLRTVGGVERYFTNFASYSSMEYEHHVLLSSDEIHPFFKPLLEKSNIKVHSLRKWSGLYLPKHPLFLRKWLHNQILKKHGIDTVLIWNKLEKFPLHFSNNLKLIHFERGSAWLAKGDEPIKKHLGMCKAILSNSQAGLGILEERWGLPKGIPQFVVNNGVNPTFIEKPALIKTKKEVVTLGFAGRFVPLKGWILSLLTLKELISRNSGSYRLIVAGEGRQKELFSNLVRELKLEDYVEDMGLVKDMRDFFDRIDIFLHTSIREPFGNVAIEAQAMGCPVIAGLVDGNPEIIQDQKTGILLPMEDDIETISHFDKNFLDVPPFVWNPTLKNLDRPRLMSAIKMADAVETISKDSEALSRYSTNASNWIREGLNFENQLKCLKETLTKVLE